MSDETRMAIASRLRVLTPARVGLGRSGVSQLSRDVLNFQASHALARDAVKARLDVEALAADVAECGLTVLRLRSAAEDRAIYLQRPDLGRTLDEVSRELLVGQAGGGCDVVIVMADGLSATAVQRHVAPLLERVLPRVEGKSLGPVCIVEQGRVAVGDAIGEVMGARLCVVLIGERPGLSSPDSLGAYVTWAPRVGRTDAERLCISNIRPEGLGYDAAAEQLERAVAEAFERRVTGVLAAKAGA